jgi:ubiquinone/menaquinone biosynthesis C-methylase UbiE
MHNKNEAARINLSAATLVPAYLEEIYWWAYVHPRAVMLFERQWLVNVILWGNFPRLRDAALAALGDDLEGKTLQVACVYGDFTPRLSERIAEGGQLDVVDILPIQLQNLRAKLAPGAPVKEHLCNSATLSFDNSVYDQTVLFFLLHEQPESVRRATLAEAVRVTRPGGKIVIVDYHLPQAMHPLRYLFRPVLHLLEPFALDLWRHEISAWLPPHIDAEQIDKQTYYGGLYQRLVIEV